MVRDGEARPKAIFWGGERRRKNAKIKNTSGLDQRKVKGLIKKMKNGRSRLRPAAVIRPLSRSIWRLVDHKPNERVIVSDGIISVIRK